jgi:hypothetical protein
MGFAELAVVAGFAAVELLGTASSATAIRPVPTVPARVRRRSGRRRTMRPPEIELQFLKLMDATKLPQTGSFSVRRLPTGHDSWTVPLSRNRAGDEVSCGFGANQRCPKRTQR